MIFISPIIYFLIYFLSFWVNFKLMKGFANKNNFSFIGLNEKEVWLKITQNGTAEEIANYTLYLFSEDIFPQRRYFYRKIFNNIKGKYKGKNIEIYNYQHECLVYVVFEIETKITLPTVIITANRGSLIHFLDSENFFDFIIPEKLETESNEFNKNFKIFFRKNYERGDEMKMLRVLTPDIMVRLIDEEKKSKGKDIHLEFNRNRIILYKRIHIISPSLSEKEMQDLLDLTFEVAEEAEK